MKNYQFGCLLLASIIVPIGVINYVRSRDAQLYSRVSQQLDVNKDGLTSLEEWKPAYNHLKIHLDAISPRKLEQSELVRALEFLAEMK